MNATTSIMLLYFLSWMCIVNIEAQKLVTFYQIHHSSAHTLVTFLQIRHYLVKDAEGEQTKVFVPHYFSYNLIDQKYVVLSRMSYPGY